MKDMAADELDYVLKESQTHLDALDLLYATLHWREDGQLETTHHPMPLSVMSAKVSLGAVIRVELPRSGINFPQIGETIAAELNVLIKACAQAGVSLSLITIDADPPTRLLSDYIEALRAPRVAAGEVPFTVTALLDHTRSPALKRFAEAAGHLTLQLHSLEIRARQLAPLVDRDRVGVALKRMSALGRPYSVSLPTYGYLVRLSRGVIKRVYAERSWPPLSHHDRDMIVSARPREIAALLSEWRSSPPLGLDRVHWFRLPLRGDRLNWRWRTFSAVLRGAPLSTELELICNRSGERVYFAMRSRGDLAERASVPLRLTWDGPAPQEIFAEGNYRGSGVPGNMTLTPVQLNQTKSHLMKRRQWQESRAEVAGSLKPLGSAIISPEVKEIRLERAESRGAWVSAGEACRLSNALNHRPHTLTPLEVVAPSIDH